MSDIEERCLDLLLRLNDHALRAELGRGEKILRDLYLIDDKNYVLDVDRSFIARADELQLHLRFSTLRGVDLIFACAAVIEDATLVTRDTTFLGLEGLRVIIPKAPADREGYELSFWGGRVNSQRD